ncbi:hypothetical protein ES288_D05G078500v1 [Gossypium darwinii]|uniref:Beta-glucosidase 11 isoform X1 n=2 Tax=Gossypium TaxID=3633 RepID=A0ABM3A3Z7_GOSHI|nr:beta-glucosidase 11 isoform X1 [Gossypium hirsutum]TYG67466.1 hypothetical protein ES288_D05G078500v1 [Gossypium darwinii]
MDAAKLNLGFNLFFIFQLKFVVFAAVGGGGGCSRSDFPPGFVFGASTSAYQYEGAADKDGRTPSIWDTFVHAEGNFNEGNGDIACDGYHKYKEDVGLMVDTGLEAYRFSISWSRLIPNGRGPVNVKGLQYYNNLINELIKNGIQPHATLHHYDLPQTLEDEYGGWLNREIVKDFTAYADICFREFGDRVLYWTTVNEANVFVLGGYDLGFEPPQRCSAPSPFNCSKGNSSTEPYLAAHNILLAHAAVAKLYKKKHQKKLMQEKQHGLVGFNLFNYWFVPLTNTTEDIIAVQRANDFYFGWFMHPLVYGDYPRSMKENAGSRLPAFTSSESKQVKGSFDFIGLNFYNTMSVKDQPSSLEMEHRDPAADMAIELIPFPHNASKFEFSVTPWALKGLLEYVKEAYGNPPIYIHENGQRTRQNSSLEDWPRVKSLNAYIGSVLDAIRNGSNTRGYFTWSFMDLFELLDGYESSYGLYYVDLEDPGLRRVPKLSAKWYSEFLKGKYVDFNEVIQLQDASFSDAQLTH